ncbi:MAG: aminotransferase class I/II-fold pyridoxal phosphate-dependent enzyme [Lachnospiraceae bacterium]|nr:aminotransferase class I/II-fold pyridoxal phosphate-dependent enzyme [Lachnospiraceae bacterium]
MKLVFSKKSSQIEGGIFNILNDKKKELLNKGMKVYNFSIGTPDFQPAPHIMEAMQDACKDPQNYKYAIDDKPELVQAMADYYKNRFGVTLAEDEIMTVYGSQEGMTHLGWAICDPGDLVLVPNPGYPIFSIGPMFCDAEIYEYPIYPEDNYMLKFENIPEEIAKRAKMIVVSYPLNPVCAVADDKFYEELIAFAKKYNIIVLHDNAYADIVYGGRVGKSFLEYEGAKEVGIEFYSLSKTYNMTGMRISFTVGNAQIISQFKKVRSQIDYGIFPAIQKAAVAALTGPQDMVKEQCAEYERRNQALCGGLRKIGWNVPDSQGSMFVWAPIPENFTSSEKFVLELMEKSGVIVVPGTAFGSLGEGYVRFALVYPVEEIEKAVQAIADSGILK